MILNSNDVFYHIPYSLLYLMFFFYMECIIIDNNSNACRYHTFWIYKLRYAYLFSYVYLYICETYGLTRQLHICTAVHWKRQSRRAIKANTHLNLNKINFYARMSEKSIQYHNLKTTYATQIYSTKEIKTIFFF